jgi:hypothetical protein
MAISDDERRDVARWSAGSAERALALFAADRPEDGRPAEALAGARAYADGERRTRHLRVLALAAHAAARDAADPAAASAARAAGLAAAVAYIHGEATIGTLGHIVGAAVAAAEARRIATGDAAAADEEIRWAVSTAPASVRALVRRIPPGRDRPNRLDPLRDRLVEGLLG